MRDFSYLRQCNCDRLHKKKTAADTRNIGDGKTKNTVALSIAEPECFVNVKQCTKAYQMNTYQRLIVREVYKWAKTREQLVSELKKLQFCTFEAALRYLVCADLITCSDVKNILDEE